LSAEPAAGRPARGRWMATQQGRIPVSRRSPFYSRDGRGALPESCVAALLRNSRPLSLRRGERLFSEGQVASACYWVVSGLLRGSIAAGEGESVVVSVHGPGDLIGEITSIVDQPRVTTVDAIWPCKLTAIDNSIFGSALHDYPELARWLSSALALRMREMYFDQAARARRMPNRVAYALLKVSQLTGEPLDDARIGLPLALSHDVLASIAGVSRESASRALGEWRKQGIVSRSDGFSVVVQKQALELECWR